MDALEAIQARRSIRQFTEAPVPREVLAQILEAGRQAPSGKNRQPWHFVVIQGAKKTEAMEVMRGALARREEQLLAAVELDLGTLWICDVFYAYDELRQLLGRQDQMIAAIAIGYPDESPEPRSRKPIEEIVTWVED
jgi:nitroreductase